MADKTLVCKSFGAFEVKDAEKGEVEAVIATIGVVDRDEEIIRPGAIADGSKVSVSDYGHSAVFGDRPVGKGKVFVEGNKAIFRGRLFLKMFDGRETFECLKEMGPDQQWSFGFEVLGAEVPTEAEKKQGARRALTKLDSFEVSPVIRGAGIGTRTVGVKHETAPAEDPPTPPPADDPPPPPAEDPPAPDAGEAERVAAERAEADRLEAERVAGENAAAERADQEFKAATLAAKEEFERVQRTLKRLQFI